MIHYSTYFQSLLHYYHIKFSKPLQAVTLLLLWEAPAQIKLLLATGFLQERPQCPLSNLLQGSAWLEVYSCATPHENLQQTSAEALNYASFLTVFSSWQFHWKKGHPKHFRLQRLKFTQNDTNHSQICWFNPSNTKYNLCQQKEYSRCCWRC